MPSLDITIDNYNDNVVDHCNEASMHINDRIKSFTNAQSIIFNSILNAVNGNGNKCFFIDGPGGSGKSYILNTRIAYLKNNKINVLPVAWTGIAANLLEDGKTVHTAFKLPLNIHEQTTCNIYPNTNNGVFLKNVQVIIWDEITMTSKYAFEAFAFAYFEVFAFAYVYLKIYAATTTLLVVK